LPVELWLAILEQTSIIDAKHLWTVVRHVSRSFRTLAESAFASSQLQGFAISLSLPRRAPASNALVWPGAIPQAQIVMSFDRTASNSVYAIFASQETIGKDAERQSLEYLKDSNVLPLERLLAAPAWVFFNTNHLTGVTLKIPERITWDKERKVWIWEVEWKALISQFYQAKKLARRR
ncbi:hypothetical protein FB567DRAFT_426793, partial [Paraphoma chrysanthemicola]